ncbi:MAG TPA: kelch repeat-containing protein [Verrucomicrobiota bacterium]|nr:MAG: Kelch motif protein [Verrucomicrobia bacterium ADurb.Bin118]HPY31278.1 kelch repeat-containing protein [Verrucomicrobiota bacterium]HQB17637.1 kelch repeat-containing protein [Verrucomicrobiota bacterium]
MLNVARGYHKAVLLPSGQVLVAGGSDSGFNHLSSAELFTPATGQWTMTGTMKSPRVGFAALLLPNGEVLAAGGQNPMDTALNTAELYRPTTGTWSWTTAMANARADNGAVLLPDGTALLVDGWDNTSDTPASELYNPTTGTWSTAATFNSPRFHTTATLMPNGQVLAVGGQDSSHNVFAIAQLYDTGSGPIAPPTLASPKTLPDTALQLTFASRYGSVFSVLATENVAASLSAWPVIGVAVETSPGQFQFTDAQATNSVQRFYRLRSP